MFQDIQLTIKRGNKASGPDASWTIKDKLYCSAVLHLGFGESVEWEGTDLVSLKQLITFYRQIADPFFVKTGERFTEVFPCRGGSVSIDWGLVQAGTISFSITYGKKGASGMMQKNINTFETARWKEAFAVEVMRQLAGEVPAAVCLHVGALLDPPAANDSYLFKTGQKVRTILNTRVRTLRIGYIMHRYYHMNDGTHMYQLIVDGKLLEKRYAEEDLEIMA